MQRTGGKWILFFPSCGTGETTRPFVLSPRRLNLDAEVYLLPTNTGLMIAFKVGGNKVEIESLFRQDTLKKFAETTR
jgi:hypothetical protein